MNKVRMPKARFGELAIGAGIITQEQLDTALKQQKEGDSRNLGEILRSMNAMDFESVEFVLDIQEKLKNGGCDVEKMLEESHHADDEMEGIRLASTAITKKLGGG